MLKQGERLTKSQLARVELLLRENADLSAAGQAKILTDVLGHSLSTSTIYRYREQFGTPKPHEAKRQIPIALTRGERKVLKRLLTYLVVPASALIARDMALEIPGLDQISYDDGESFRFVIGDDYTIDACWFTAEEREFFEHIISLADRRRGTDLFKRFAVLHDLMVEYANRAFWYGVHKAIRLEQQSPSMRRIPKSMTSMEFDEESEQDWLHSAIRKLDVRVLELKSSVELATGL